MVDSELLPNQAGEIENSGKKHGKSRMPNFCYIQIIVFERCHSIKTTATGRWSRSKTIT